MFKGKSATVIEFDQVSNLPSDTLRRALCYVENQLLEWAMFGATKSAQRAIYGALTERGAVLLKDNVELLGPLAPELIAIAQRQIVGVINLVENEPASGQVRLAS